ncbi:MAG: hypothetical protein K0R41_3243, partial [Geminicoccaceae bacterium]|nr:hypothetical protein [Geminicoccaceae bacterium]
YRQCAAPPIGSDAQRPGLAERPMEHYHYPTTSLVPDYLRGAFGLAITAGPLAALDLAQGVALLLSGLAVVFAWFGVRTALRQLSWVELSPADIALCGPIRRRLPWQEVRRMQLAYYAPRRAQQDGWLQLTLRGRSGPAIRVDSTLDGFDDVLRLRPAPGAPPLPHGRGSDARP